MAHLIDKDALVAYIERFACQEYNSFCDKLLDYINSLEVKEVHEEPVSEDLEEAANDYGIRQGAELKPFAIKFFKAGAKWQKEQMMKGALEAVMTRLPDGTFNYSTKNLIDDDMEERGFCLFDYHNVKIVLVNEG